MTLELVRGVRPKASPQSKSSRPRGSRNKMPALNEERLKSIIMAEAYRTIKVNDGPRQISVPMAQAIIRSLAVNAVKGQHRAQRLFSELLSATERDGKALTDDWRDVAFEYKKSWEEEIERCKRLDLPPPDPVPHPDHIDLDMNTGQVIIDGPMNPKQRAAGRELVARFMTSGEELLLLQRERDKPKNARIYDILDADVAHEAKFRDMKTDAIFRTPWLLREWKAAIKTVK